MIHITEFSREIQQRLNYYVYRLIDPRNGETFYVGKGVGNRLFAHVAGALVDASDGLGEKIERIREIRNVGLEVVHIVHRHGMTEEVAFEVEAALIDAFPGLSNEVGGHNSGDRGPMHVWEIKRRYEAEAIVFHHKVLLISINRSATARELYDATRYAWRIDAAKAREADYVLAEQSGLVVAVFRVDNWFKSSSKHFEGFPSAPGRWGFVGAAAPEDVVRLYVHKRTPKREKGAANPVRYFFSGSALSEVEQISL